MTSEPQETTFFIDRCLGKHTVVEALRSTDVSVEVHDDHFPKTAQDLEWIPVVGHQDWVILTKDARIGRNALERQVVARAGLRMFTLASQNLSGEESAKIFHKALNAMLKFAQNNPRPFIAKVYKDGKVKAWKNAQDLLAEIEAD